MPPEIAVGEEQHIVQGHIRGVRHIDTGQPWGVAGRVADREDDIAPAALRKLVREDHGKLVTGRQVLLASIGATLYDQAHLRVEEEAELLRQLIREPLTGCLVDVNKGVTVCKHLYKLGQDRTIKLRVAGYLYVSHVVRVVEEQLSKARDLLRACY